MWTKRFSRSGSESKTEVLGLLAVSTEPVPVDWSSTWNSLPVYQHVLSAIDD